MVHMGQTSGNILVKNASICDEEKQENDKYYIQESSYLRVAEGGT